MILKKCILTANDCYQEGTKMAGNRPTGIVVHSTGANNKSIKRYVQPLKSDADYNAIIADIGTNAYNNHWNIPVSQGGRDACVHAFIGVNAAGKVETYQTLPFDICGWGVGKGSKGSYNYNPQARVQFEICEDDLNDATYFNAVMKEAQEFCAYLCKMYGFGADKINSHYESYQQGYGSNHSDPHNWLKPFGKDMNWFRTEVKKILDAKAKPETQKTIYRVQTGAFKSKTNADKLEAELKSKKFATYIVQVGGFYKVQVGAFGIKANADAMLANLKDAGYSAFVTTNGAAAAASTTEIPAGFSVGDKVKCNTGVKTFANGGKMASWVPVSALYVRAVESGGKILLVSTEPVKAVYTGRVNASDVHKI